MAETTCRWLIFLLDEVSSQQRNNEEEKRGSARVFYVKRQPHAWKFTSIHCLPQCKRSFSFFLVTVWEKSLEVWTTFLDCFSKGLQIHQINGLLVSSSQNEAGWETRDLLHHKKIQWNQAKMWLFLNNFSASTNWFWYFETLWEQSLNCLLFPEWNRIGIFCGNGAKNCS